MYLLAAPAAERAGELVGHGAGQVACMGEIVFHLVENLWDLMAIGKKALAQGLSQFVDPKRIIIPG